MCYLNGKISGSSRNRRSISEPGFHAELRTSAINGSSPDGHEDENSSSEDEAGGDKRGTSSVVWKEAEGRKGFQMCNSHVLECPFSTNNNLSLDCQDFVEKILEDGFGIKVHNLQDSVPSSSSTCLKEPDFVVTCVARNDEESSSRSDVQVSVIESPEIVPFGFGKEIMNEGEFKSRYQSEVDRHVKAIHEKIKGPALRHMSCKIC